MLEETIRELTQSIQALTQALIATRVLDSKAVTTPSPSAISTTQKTSTPTRTPSTTPSVAAPPAQHVPAKLEEVPPTQETLRAAFLTLVDQRGREAALSLLAEEGVGRAGELKPEVYPRVLNKIHNLLRAN